MVKLKAPYPGSRPKVARDVSRTFLANVKVVNIAGALDEATASVWHVSPSVIGTTRTLEFNSDGTMRFYQAVSGSTCVTVDGNPQNRMIVLAATSRVKVEAEAC